MPELLKPQSVFLLGHFAESSLVLSWFAIAARFALHQDEFDIVLDNRVGFVRFAKEFTPVLDLVIRVGDFMPYDRVEVVETKLTTHHADVGMKRHHQVSAIASARQADIANHTDQPSSRNKHSQTFAPNITQGKEKLFVIRDVTELVRIGLILLQCSIGRRCEHKVNRFILDEGQIASVSVDEVMHCPRQFVHLRNVLASLCIQIRVPSTTLRTAQTSNRRPVLNTRHFRLVLWAKL